MTSGHTLQTESSFEQVADRQTRALTRTIAIAAMALLVLLLPYDLLVNQTDSSAASVLVTMRLQLMGIILTFFLVSRFVGDRVSGLVLALVPAFAITGVFGYAVGRLAHRDGYWFASLYMLPLCSGPFLIRLRVRVLVAATCVLIPLLCFRLSFRGHLSTEHFVHTLGLFIMAATFTVMGGEVYYRHARTAYDLRRALDEKRKELGVLNEGLEQRVAEQTSVLRALASRLDEALESERRRFARELHDDLGQELTAMKLEIEAIRAQEKSTVPDGIERVSAAIARSHISVRRVLESLRPRVLDEQGLAEAVRWLLQGLHERSGILCHSTIEVYDDPDPQVSLTIFRLAQESLTNIARHAKASNVWLTLHCDGAKVMVEVQDDGVGIDGSAAENRFGLTGMRERVAALQGQLVIEGRQPTGTLVRATMAAQPS